MRSAEAGSGCTLTGTGRPFCHSRKAGAASGPPAPGTATITPTRDGSTATVPTTRTPRAGGWLAEDPVGWLAESATAGVADATTATTTAVTHSSRPRTRRPHGA